MTDSRLTWMGKTVALPGGAVGCIVGLEADGPRLLVQVDRHLSYLWPGDVVELATLADRVRAADQADYAHE